MKNLSLFVILLFATAMNSFSAETQKMILVLGSGGSRGLAHVGVIEELENLGIVPDMIVGCSSGAIVGALYAQSKDIEKVKEILIDLTQDDLLDFTLFQKYAFSTRDKLEKLLEEHLTVTDFASLQIPLIVVATDLQKGEPVYFQEGGLHPALLASSALPGLFPPYKIDDQLYVDGGVSDPLPVQFARSLGDAVILASDISPSLDGFDTESLPDIVLKAFEIAYQRLARAGREEADLLFTMNFLDTNSPIADGGNHKLYERGKEEVRSQSEQLKKWSMTVQWPSNEE